MVARIGGRPAPVTDSIVRGADWYGKDLSGVVHERVLFQDLDLTEATGQGARFVDCTFGNSTFACVVLDDPSFENCTFARCSFFDAEFRGSKFLGAMFDECKFDQLRVVGGDWSFTGLPAADLRYAKFVEVRMREADLTGARCRGSVLTNCDLSGAMWSKADLTSCDLRGSDLSSLEPEMVQLAGAIITWNQAVVIAGSLGLDVRPE
jgi:fluoroquinolone resistance protein